MIAHCTRCLLINATCLAPFFFAPNLNVCPCTHWQLSQSISHPRARLTYGCENNADGVIEASVPRLLLRLAIVNTSGHQGSDLEGKRVNEKFAGQEAADDTRVSVVQRGCDIVVLANHFCDGTSMIWVGCAVLHLVTMHTRENNSSNIETQAHTSSKAS